MIDNLEGLSLFLFGFPNVMKKYDHAIEPLGESCRLFRYSGAFGIVAADKRKHRAEKEEPGDRLSD